MDKFLIVTDMQNDFISEALGSDAAKEIVPAVVERIREARLQDEQVWFTLDTHDDRYMETQEGELLPIEHCLRGSAGWQLAPEIERAKTDNMRVFEKAVFGSQALVDALVDHAHKNKRPGGRGMFIEVCGLCTDICVITNALLIKTALPEAIINVQGHLCAGLSPERHEAALEVMRSCQIIVRA